MIPYRVSVLAPNTGADKTHDIKLYAAFAESDEEALRAVSDAMPAGWRVDRVAGLLSRFEVERLRLAHGEVREVSSFTIDGLFLPEEALYASNGSGHSELH
ncbi:hypothetical protein [Methylobacterium sp. WL120]|uniref:hypothetical protein n=1 Tax=Methylobacterium sp. WL120 TaxID=2603887 RepID=UPI0011CB36BA|nr:hypothetical protein [Methylobacterium sp. WL120]TXM69970.1 hypothetical protein FV229_03785 [Methylobacterium sp. WL120]